MPSRATRHVQVPGGPSLHGLQLIIERSSSSESSPTHGLSVQYLLTEQARWWVCERANVRENEDESETLAGPRAFALPVTLYNVTSICSAAVS